MNNPFFGVEVMSRYVECKTGDGLLVSLKCEEDVMEEVKKALLKVRSLYLPTTHRTMVAHGGYGSYTRFDMTQHKYAAGGHPGLGGYFEVLEITNPPDGRCGNILHEHCEGVSHRGSTFYEFETIKDAIECWEKHWGSDWTSEVIPREKGFLRHVECGLLQPWFYAVGQQSLMGDMVFPDYMDDDPVFRPLCPFVVYDRDGFPTVKTCLGSRRVRRRMSLHSSETREYLLVQWDDGTVWDEYEGTNRRPRALTERELVIQEAMDQFRVGLAGKEREFTIHFTDGSRFVGKFRPADTKTHPSGGEYYAQTTTKSGDKRDGTFQFEPSLDTPTVEAFLESKGIAKIHLLKFRRKGASKKKWAGVFSSPVLA